MKTILIAAASLMTAASVYGLIDYNKRSAQPEFRKLYHEEKLPAIKVEKPVENPEQSKTVAIEEAVKGSRESVNKPKRRAPKVALSEFSRARLERYEEPAIVPVKAEADSAVKAE